MEGLIALSSIYLSVTCEASSTWMGMGNPDRQSNEAPGPYSTR